MSVAEFLASRPFEADRFQIEAVEALDRGASVLVTAPTGSGKTLVAEAAVYLAQRAGRRCFYTTPIKALSNQKFGDLINEYGAEAVGLLTGDNVVNSTAPIIVMTTEVLRNMIYADRAILDDVEFVILDEVHYLQDRFRGAVWEEVIIHAPAHVRLVCLSATVANSAEFNGWLEERRGAMELVFTDHRPVPLERLYMLADRHSEDRIKLLPLFQRREGRDRANSRLQHLLSLEKGGRRRFSTPGRVEVVEHLASLDMLPCIYFIFSRAGCEGAAQSLIDAGLKLVGSEEQHSIRAVVEERTSHLGDRDLAALGYSRWISGLEAGVAAHHAGLVPAFKETVEELFRIGLVKVVFATETLALGINMPARSVVLDALSKFDGEGHSLLGPGDYTQLTGRAGRRGIDEIGYGVVLHSRYNRFEQVVEIASTGSHPLRSSFRPTYNMAANLIANYSPEDAERLLTASFAQYQRRGSHEESLRRLSEMEARLPDEYERSTCELGSVSEYAQIVDGSAATSVSGLAGRLQAGDVIDVPSGPRAGRFLVLRRLNRGKNGYRFLVMGSSGRISNISGRDVVAGSGAAGTIELPRKFQPTDRTFQASTLRRIRSLPKAKSDGARSNLEHPVAECPRAAEHLKWLRRAMRTENRIEHLRSDLRQSGVGLVEEFQAIHDLLDEWSYTKGWALTLRGERLRFLYNESDLLLTETTERGLLWNVMPADLAALLSVFVFEARSDEPSSPVWPSDLIHDRFVEIESLWEELAVRQRVHRLPVTRRPDPGFVSAAWGWAQGAELDDLGDLGMAPGDFVRVARQLVDLLRQVRENVPELADDAGLALNMVNRGVVAAQGATP